MKRLAFFFYLISLVAGLIGQPFQSVFEKDLSPSFFDYFLSSGEKNFYLSPDGQRLFFTSDLKYTVLSAEDGSIIAEDDNVQKANAGMASFLGILKNRSLNRKDALEEVRFDEGTEYMAFDEKGIVVMMDWSKDKNIIKAIDLKSGEIKWQTERYRYSASSKSQMLDLILGMAGANFFQREYPQDIARASANLQGFGEQTFTTQKASPAAYGFMIPLPSANKVMLRVQDKYVALDLDTGEEKWVYDKRVLNIGFSDIASDGNLVIVNFNSSYFQANERLILKLDVETGEEIWTTKHLSDFRAGRTYMVGDRLVCDYYGSEVFDLNHGERILISLDERVINTQNKMTQAFASDASGSRGTEAIASPSVVQGQYLYTSCFKLGKRFFANDGSSKAIVQKYDLENGKMLWQSDKLGRGTDLSFASEDFVFVREGQAMGKSALFILDAATGEVLTETDNIDGFIYREGAADILTQSYLYRAGKKSVYAFNQENWKLEKEFDTRKSKVGKLQAMIPAYNELLAVGDKGLVFFDASGKTEDAIQTEPIIGTFWTGDYGFIFTTKNTLAIDLKERKIAKKLPLSVENGVQVLFSEDASQMMMIRGGQTLLGYKNN